MSAHRKVVTVLFCDVVGSTALGESVDPEALQGLLARYFDRMKGIVESHGGSVEKFIGDAVMAVFGVPRAHEDDALRACRAAIEMRDALPAVGLEGRIGVMTGEVVTGTEERLATGDAVNVAARLEQAAAPGDVLIGKPTFELARDALEVEAFEPLELKGKTQPVDAYRLKTVHEPVSRLAETSFVGRLEELATIKTTWERALAEQRCELFTIAGEAGVGKSRLVAEALTLVESRVVQGRCLPYGEGVTYWPVIEVLKQLDAVPSDPVAASAIRSLLGTSQTGTSAEEIAWAFRKLLEESGPLVCVFDDIQWAEETFLDLLEHVALLSSGAPLLLLCMARLELLERRPTWPLRIRLEPLPRDEIEALIGEQVSPGLRDQIVRGAGGNPLFVGEMLAIADEARGEIEVPPTLHAVLSTRLDQLDPAERRVLECGSVEGEVFHRGAVQVLAAEAGQVTPRLAALVRKGLVRTDRPQLPSEDGFRFRHLLIRDAAYSGLPKSTRANLHERLASWFEERWVDLAELEEILGYHLEKAARYKQELDQPDPALAQRASDWLAAAGRRALWRADNRAAASHLERALLLTRPFRLDVHLELDLASAHTEHEPAKAVEIAEAVARRARGDGNELGELLAVVVAKTNQLEFAEDPDVDGLERIARRALREADEQQDDAGLVYVWSALGQVGNFRFRMEDRLIALEKALRHARRAGQQQFSNANWFAGSLIYGPRPADEALQALDAAQFSPTPSLLANRAHLLGMLERFAEAWSLADEAVARYEDLLGRPSGGLRAYGELAALAGDYEAAARDYREFCDWCNEHGRLALLGTYAPLLGRLLCRLGHYEDAERFAKLGREISDEGDPYRMLWRQAQALVDAHNREFARAEHLAREAVEITERTDSLNFQGDALLDLAEVLQRAGNEESVALLRQALDRFELKRNLPMSKRVRTLLAEAEASDTAAERA